MSFKFGVSPAPTAILFQKSLTEAHVKHCLSCVRPSVNNCVNTCRCINHVLNSDLKKMSEWSRRWLVDFNPTKTDVILFSTRNAETIPNLLFGNVPLSLTDSHTHLGITLCENAKWDHHIDNIIASSSKKLNILRKLKFKLSYKNLEQMYISYIRPVLEYADVVWDGCTKDQQDRLEKVQHEAARSVSGLD